MFQSHFQAPIDSRGLPHPPIIVPSRRNRGIGESTIGINASSRSRHPDNIVRLDPTVEVPNPVNVVERGHPPNNRRKGVPFLNNKNLSSPTGASPRKKRASSH
ncbi:hypothetical protein SUGI_0992220 [Cryptomeria japonica]|nr:hypothetical protein SUGI_0992220 [Cryptomeria japonica]